MCYTFLIDFGLYSWAFLRQQKIVPTYRNETVGYSPSMSTPYSLDKVTKEAQDAVLYVSAISSSDADLR